MWPTSQPFCRGQIGAYKSSPEGASVMCISGEATLLKHSLLSAGMLMDGHKRMEKYSVSRYALFPLDPLVDSSDPLRLCWQDLCMARNCHGNAEFLHRA